MDSWAWAIMEHPAVSKHLKPVLLNWLAAHVNNRWTIAHVAQCLKLPFEEVKAALDEMAAEEPPRVTKHCQLACVPMYQFTIIVDDILAVVPQATTIALAELTAEHRVGLVMARSGRYKATDYASASLGWLAARGMVNVVDGAVTITAIGLAMDDAVKVAQAERRAAITEEPTAPKVARRDGPEWNW